MDEHENSQCTCLCTNATTRHNRCGPRNKRSTKQGRSVGPRQKQQQRAPWSISSTDSVPVDACSCAKLVVAWGGSK